MNKTASILPFETGNKEARQTPQALPRSWMSEEVTDNCLCAPEAVWNHIYEELKSTGPKSAADLLCQVRHCTRPHCYWSWGPWSDKEPRSNKVSAAFPWSLWCIQVSCTCEPKITQMEKWQDILKCPLHILQIVLLVFLASTGWFLSVPISFQLPTCLHIQRWI